MSTANKASSTSKYSKYKSVAEWASKTGLPPEEWEVLEGYLLELAAYLNYPHVRRTEVDGSSSMIFGVRAFDAAWHALAGDPARPDHLARATEALRVFTKLKSHPELLTLGQFLLIAAVPELLARRTELKRQVDLAFEGADQSFGRPPRFVDFDVKTGEVRKQPMLPRTLLVCAVNGDLLAGN